MRIFCLERAIMNSRQIGQERQAFEEWFSHHYRPGHQPSGNPRDYSLDKDSAGRYLWLRAAVAWQAWQARSIQTVSPRQ